MNQICEECKSEINPNDNYWHDKKGYFLCESCFIAALSQNIEDGIQDLDDLDAEDADDFEDLDGVNRSAKMVDMDDSTY